MITFRDAGARYMQNSKHFSPAWAKCNREYLGRLYGWIGEVPVGELNTGRITDVRTRLLDRGLKPRTVNHYLSTVVAVLHSAKDYGDILSVPRVRKLRAGRREVNLRPADAARLFEVLPDYMRPMARFALATGLRRGNVCRLRWDQVSLDEAEVHIAGDEMKNRDPLCVPLSPVALEVLREQQGQHPVWVFSWRGAPLRVKLAPTWRRALGAAGLEGLHWHDLRHAWASHHARRGTPQQALQALGGWKTAAMVARYAHLQVEDLRRWV